MERDLWYERGRQHGALSRREDDAALGMPRLFHCGSSTSLSVEWRL